MKVAIMQPYFFPYIGQFQLLYFSDRFVLMDQVQYIRHGWINRNRIQSLNSEFQYIVAPVRKHSHKSMIYEIEVVNDNSWRNTILKQLDIYRKKAPFYSEVRALVSDCMSYQETNITKLNAYCFASVCSYLGITPNIEIASELQLQHENCSGAQELAICLTQQLGGTTYFNAPGGVSLYDRNAFGEAGISLKFISPKLSVYEQGGRSDFVSGLSIIDVLMYNSPQAVIKMINDCEII